jgi:ATP-dependent Lon protease
MGISEYGGYALFCFCGLSRNSIMNDTIKPNPSIETLDHIPNVLPVLPLRDIVLFPYMIFPVLVGRETSLRAANEALERGKNIFLVAQKYSSIDEPTDEDVYREGTVAKILQMLKLPNGLMKILVDGVAQASIKKFIPNPNFLEAEIIINRIDPPAGREIEALVRHVSALFAEYVRLNRNIPPEIIMAYDGIKEPQRKMFYIASNLVQSVEVKQRILQTPALRDQLYELSKILNTEVEILKIERDIDTKVQDNIQKSQRKFFIQEQIRILQDEIGRAHV